MTISLHRLLTHYKLNLYNGLMAVTSLPKWSSLVSLMQGPAGKCFLTVQYDIQITYKVFFPKMFNLDLRKPLDLHSIVQKIQPRTRLNDTIKKEIKTCSRQYFWPTQNSMYFVLNEEKCSRPVAL